MTVQKCISNFIKCLMMESKKAIWERSAGNTFYLKSVSTLDLLKVYTIIFMTFLGNIVQTVIEKYVLTVGVYESCYTQFILY